MATSVWRRAMLSRRVAAGVEHCVVLRQLGDVRTLVDIGANRGQFALAARYCFPNAKIISFEPLPGPAAVFYQVFAGDNATELHEIAIGPEVENWTMHVSARDDSSSLLPISSLQGEIFPGTSEIDTINVQVTLLDKRVSGDEIVAPALLKLDVQGFELAALQGCESLLREFSWVYVECSFVELYEGQALADAVIAWLRVRDFILSGAYNMSYDREGRAIQADFLFERRNGVG